MFDDELAELTPTELADERDQLTERLSRLPDLSKQLREASDETKRATFQAFRLRIEFDKTEGRIGIGVTVSDAVARAFSDADGGLRVPVGDIAGAGFEPATFGL